VISQYARVHSCTPEKFVCVSKQYTVFVIRHAISCLPCIREAAHGINILQHRTKPATADAAIVCVTQLGGYRFEGKNNMMQ
jgi:hypothetical protein